MKQYLVTGAAGFIGSHLTRKISREPGIVHALIRPGEVTWRLDDLASEIMQKKIQLHEVDLLDQAAITELINTIKPNVIFHCASYGGMPFELDTHKIYEVNLTASMHFYNACKAVGFDCFITTGSSSEYGRKECPLAENMLLEPMSDYAISKAAMTHYLLKEALFEHLPAYTVRPFSVYGDAELSTRLIPTILKGALFKTPLMLSSPHYVRDYIYIDDMIEALWAVYQKQPKEHFIFNAGTGTQSSIGDVVTTVSELVGYPLEVVWGTQRPRPWEPTTWVADTTQSANILGWKSRFTLRQGLAKALGWFENYHKQALMLSVPATLSVHKKTELDQSTQDKLRSTAISIRQAIMRMTSHAKSSHVGCSMSIADILTILYHHEVDPVLIQDESPDRDIIILSKGHAASALYATLASVGIIDPEHLASYGKDGSILCGHPIRGLRGVEASTGSLGHGLSLAVGMAIAGKHDRHPRRHYVIVGDGECQEGSIWEAAFTAARFQLASLTVFVDYNNLQGLDQTDAIMPGPLEKKFAAFGWDTLTIDGHSFTALHGALEHARTTLQPTAIIARTCKGQGVSFLENSIAWHYKSLSPVELIAAEEALCLTEKES